MTIEDLKAEWEDSGGARVKVYVAFGGDFMAPKCVLGIFKSREAAEAYQERNKDYFIMTLLEEEVLD